MGPQPFELLLDRLCLRLALRRDPHVDRYPHAPPPLPTARGLAAARRGSRRPPSSAGTGTCGPNVGARPGRRSTPVGCATAASPSPPRWPTPAGRLVRALAALSRRRGWAGARASRAPRTKQSLSFVIRPL